MNTRPGRRVEIVGGGLAGLALGLALRRAGVPVVLWEAGSYPRHRVCGEFITGLDATTRARLGLDVFLADALRHEEMAWFRGGHGRAGSAAGAGGEATAGGGVGTVSEVGRSVAWRRRRLPESAWALSRHVLDERLAQALVAAGGELHTGVRMDLAEAPAGRVFALGRRPAPGSPWLGLKCHARGLKLHAPLEMHLGAGGYVGLCAIEDGRVNVSGLFRRRAGAGQAGPREQVLEQYLRACGLGEVAARLAGGVGAAGVAGAARAVVKEAVRVVQKASDVPEAGARGTDGVPAGAAGDANKADGEGEAGGTVWVDPASRVAVAGLAYGRERGAGGAAARRWARERLIVGDAQGLIPPFTGHGMALAWQDAAAALDPLVAWSRGEAEWVPTMARARQQMQAGGAGRRRLVAAAVQPLLWRPLGQRVLELLERAGWLPFGVLYRLTHG